ncbi:TPR domain protein [Apiospora saccharicola]
MDSPSIQPGVDETNREATTKDVGLKGRLSSMKSSPRRDSTSSITSTGSRSSSSRGPRPAGHVIRDGQIGSFNPVEVRDVPGLGKGLFAAQAIPRYSLLFAEEPLLFAPKGGDRVSNHRVRKFLEALDQLSSRTRAEFLSLYASPTQLEHISDDARARMCNWYTDVKGLSETALDDAMASGITALAAYRTNNVAVLDYDNPDHLEGVIVGGAVYSVFSRINHACHPNAAFFYLGVRSQRLGVRALRDIAAGEQIFVSYLGEKAGREMGLSQRQEGLATWGFECKCDACIKEALAEAAVKET